MSQPARHHTISYVEFTTTDIARAKQFYGTAFGWSFQDFGPEYTSFSAAQAGMDGGFCLGKASEAPGKTSPLVVLYSADLKSTEDAVIGAGGKIVVPVFEFPGGRRFHFADGAGNVLAVWSE